MDTSTGHLVTDKRLREMVNELDEEMAAKADLVARYTSVPDDLEEAARRKLAGLDEAMVSLGSGGKLSRWAAKVRRNAEAGKIKAAAVAGNRMREEP